MLIKFTGGGRGGGRSVAEYLTREEGRGHAPPEVVRGDMDRTRDLIDSIERKWSYTHGVLSLRPRTGPPRSSRSSPWTPLSVWPSLASIGSNTTSLGSAIPTPRAGGQSFIS